MKTCNTLLKDHFDSWDNARRRPAFDVLLSTQVRWRRSATRSLLAHWLSKTTPRLHHEPHPMIVRRVEQLDELLLYRQQWDALAGDCLFRSWAWQSTWWRHYGIGNRNRKLYVLLAIADTTDQPVAILPCYLETSLTRGHVLRLLGDGEVCSDHLDLLAEPSQLDEAAAAFADVLSDHTDTWDVAEIQSIDAENTALQKLVDELRKRACHVTQTEGLNSWSIELPASWDDFLAKQSKSHRKQLRRLQQRVLETPHAVWHLVESADDLETAWPILVDLHQRRRKSLGEPGCFASSRWAAFHRDIAGQLLSSGQLRLSWLEVDGQSIAAEYHFATGETTSAYQGGIDPDRLDEEPGRLSMICSIQRAINEQHTSFDLLRGDEPYKPHWRAAPHATFDYQIVPDRRTAQWRWRAWTSARRAGRLAHQFANLLS